MHNMKNMVAEIRVVLRRLNIHRERTYSKLSTSKRKWLSGNNPRCTLNHGRPLDADIESGADPGGGAAPSPPARTPKKGAFLPQKIMASPLFPHFQSGGVRGGGGPRGRGPPPLPPERQKRAPFSQKKYQKGRLFRPWRPKLACAPPPS